MAQPPAGSMNAKRTGSEAKKTPRPFEALGRSVLSGGEETARSLSKSVADDTDGGAPKARQMREEDGATRDLEGQEAQFSKQMRANIKNRNRATDHTLEGAASAMLRPSAAPVVKRETAMSSKAGPVGDAAYIAAPSSAVVPAAEVEEEMKKSFAADLAEAPAVDEPPKAGEGMAALERAKRDAKARASAYFEDLISFLEMHGLPGAYALAFSAHGIADLSQLLLLNDEALNQLIEKCEIDAMDEILLRDAFRGTSVFR